MKQYLGIMQEILDHGIKKEDRTGTGTLSIFGTQAKYDLSEGFNGELPDLEPGECFEFEDTTVIDGKAAVIYGCCHARKADGTLFEIDIPLMQLSNANPRLSKVSLH